MNGAWLSKIFSCLPLLRASGHGTRPEDQNLGLGWLYYALGRIYKPKVVVVIGSWRGFVPMMLARACRDNREGGRVVFIDPSLVDDFWKIPKAVKQHFGEFGLDNIEHHCMTTQEFVKTDTYKNLDKIGMLFVDGYHTAEQARFDHESFATKLGDGPALFHDSRSTTESPLYDEPYTHTVWEYVVQLRNRGWDVFDVVEAQGVAMVHRPVLIPE